MSNIITFLRSRAFSILFDHLALTWSPTSPKNTRIKMSHFISDGCGIIEHMGNCPLRAYVLSFVIESRGILILLLHCVSCSIIISIKYESLFLSKINSYLLQSLLTPLKIWKSWRFLLLRPNISWAIISNYTLCDRFRLDIVHAYVDRLMKC